MKCKNQKQGGGLKGSYHKPLGLSKSLNPAGNKDGLNKNLIMLKKYILNMESKCFAR